MNVGLSRPDGAAEGDVAVKTRIVDRELHREGLVLGDGAEGLVATVLREDDLPVLQGCESISHDASREGIQGRRFPAGLEEFRGVD